MKTIQYLPQDLLDQQRQMEKLQIGAKLKKQRAESLKNLNMGYIPVPQFRSEAEIEADDIEQSKRLREYSAKIFKNVNERGIFMNELVKRSLVKKFNAMYVQVFNKFSTITPTADIVIAYIEKFNENDILLSNDDFMKQLEEMKTNIQGLNASQQAKLDALISSVDASEKSMNEVKDILGNNVVQLLTNINQGVELSGADLKALSSITSEKLDKLFDVVNTSNSNIDLKMEALIQSVSASNLSMDEIKTILGNKIYDVLEKINNGVELNSNELKSLNTITSEKLDKLFQQNNDGNLKDDGAEKVGDDVISKSYEDYTNGVSNDYIDNKYYLKDKNYIPIENDFKIILKDIVDNTTIDQLTDGSLKYSNKKYKNEDLLNIYKRFDTETILNLPRGRREAFKRLSIGEKLNAMNELYLKYK